MRVLMLNNEFPPLGGGTATVNLMLLRELSGTPDLQIDLVTATAGRQAVEETFAGNIRIFKVPVGDINPHHARHRDLIAYTFRALRRTHRLLQRERYDVAMVWHAVPAGALGLWLRLTRGLPFIVRIGGSDIPGHERRYRVISTALLPLLQGIWRSAAAIVVKCDEEAHNLKRFYPRAPIRLIPNGVDTACFHPAPETVAATEPAGPLRLIIVARLIAHKGHSTLFQAMQQLAASGVAVTLSVVGTGDAEPGYRAEAAARGLSECVTFHGYQPREAVADFYRAADVFVLPSEGEGMSISTMEAMASGLALVITRTGGTENLLAEGVNGLAFAAGDATGLAACLHQLATDRARVRSMGRASRTKALGFTWSAAATAYRTLFASVAASS